MRQEVKIVIPGKPLCKMRHRSFLRGKNICTYNPQADIQKEISMQMMNQVGVLPFGDADSYEVAFQFYMPIPESISQIKRNHLLWSEHNKYPDCDNMIKFYMDAANGVLWKDDRKVYKISSIKVYSENPRTVINITGVAHMEKDTVNDILNIFSHKNFMDFSCKFIKVFEKIYFTGIPNEYLEESPKEYIEEKLSSVDMNDYKIRAASLISEMADLYAPKLMEIKKKHPEAWKQIQKEKEHAT